MAANAEIPNPVTEDYVLAEDETVDGTLTVNAGVTVYLNGKTLTVSGLAGTGTISTSDTPEGYEQLEYAEATSDGRQYIDTGVKAISEAKIVADIMYTGTANSGTYKPLISSALSSNDGNTKTSKTYGVWIWPVGGSSKWFMFFGGVEQDSSASVVQNERCVIEAAWKSNSRTLYYNGARKLNTTDSKSVPTVNETMYLPARNLGGNASDRGEFKIYSFKIYNPQSTLVRDFIPARRLSDGAVGFYDAAGKTFFESLIGTSFVASEKTFGEGCGELHLDVADGTTLQNSSVNIAKAVKVVKTGAGTYIASKENYYTGGSVIAAGKARATVTHGSYGFGAWGTEVFVEDGGQIIMNGNASTLNGYHLTIAGSGPDGNGAIYGNATKDWDSRNLESLSLSADATVKTAARDGFNLRNNAGSDFSLNLCGHTLAVTGNSRFIAWCVNVPDEGRIIADISPGNNPAVNCFYSHTGAFNAPLVDFVVPAGKAVGGEAPFVVSNMTFGGTWNPSHANCTLNVLGTYAPQQSATTFPVTTLGDAEHLSPVLDLSALSGTYDATSRSLYFQNGSSVTVETGAREISIGDCLVSFAAGGVPDPSVGFTLCTNGVAVADRSLVVKDGDNGRGIFVKNALEPAFARWVGGEWKFFMENGDEYEGGWTGGVTDTIEVRFSTEAEYEAICATNFTPAAFVMTGFAGVENATCDLTRLSFIFEEGMVVDVNGGRVKLPASMTGGTKAFTVTNSAERQGTLEVEVASGQTAINTAMSIDGDIKLVKTGPGTFVSKIAQTYTGGTDVEAGTLRPADSPGDSNYTYSGDNFAAFGTGAVNVLPGAVFNVRGNYAYTNIVLKGGTIANTFRSMSQTAKPGIFVSSLADADESYFNMRHAGQGKCSMIYGMSNIATDLGGKTLTITEYGDLSVRSALTNGTLKVVEDNGWFILEYAFDMRSTVFDNNCALNVKGVVEIGEYIHVKNDRYMRGSGSFNVHGRFCPVVDYFYRAKMLDGSILDLSRRETVFNASCTTDENKTCDLTFADNATVMIKLGGRTVANGTKIVGWTSAPSNLAGLNFVCGDEGRFYTIVKKSDGLYYRTGLAISVR